MPCRTRRRFLKTASATLALTAAPSIVRAQGSARIIVVGGGFGGATLAKYLRLWSGGALDVVLLEKSPGHVSCIMSNLVLNGRLGIDDLSFSYDALREKYGVQVLQDNVIELDGPAARVRLEQSGWRDYDRLVLAPGVRFEEVPGWDQTAVPHAWIAGDQTTMLRDQLKELPDNGTFVITVPKAPYRCPPGPYERACVVADELGRRSGALKGKAAPGGTPKVVVLDANPAIQAEQETFGRAFEDLYGDIIQYHPNATLEEVDSEKRVAITSVGDFPGDVLNIIPTHKAAEVVANAGLTDDSGWAPVDALTYESRLSGFPGVHVIGDSQASGQPKAGHMANAQAKVCADAILRRLEGLPVDGAERAAAVTTNSACYSPITSEKASWLTVVYAYDPASKSMKMVPESLGVAEEWTKDNFKTMFAWSENLFADTFG